jgi:tetratricopeptide (TPR) repeat protein
VRFRPEEAEYHLTLAGVLFRQNELRAARNEINEALELAPGSAPAWELSGDLFSREGLLNRAVADWEEAAVAGGSHALAGKIERARREMTAEEGMGRESSRYFIVLYDREVPQPLVQGFFRILDESFNLLHDRLGEYPRDEIKVILYSQVAFRDVTMAPDWAGGAYDGKIRVPVGGLKTVEEAAGLLNILVHEMTHAFLHRMAPLGLPLWFSEGLATAFQGWDPGKIRAWFAEHPPEGLATLSDVDRALRGWGGNVQAAYAAARLALADLEELRGFGAVRRIIVGVGEGQPFAETFRDEMRLEVAEFEERWARGLR